MRTTLSRCVWLLAGASLLFAAPQQGAPPLPFVSPIFGDNMVLQRGKPNAIWGWSHAGGHRARGDRRELRHRYRRRRRPLAGAAFSRPPPAGPTRCKITGRSRPSNCTTCWWATSGSAPGQSNMQFGLGQARNGAEEVKRADYPQIRFYVVGQRAAYAPARRPARDAGRSFRRTRVGGRGGGISAVAYFFGRRLQEDRARSDRAGAGSGGRRAGGDLHQPGSACAR